MQILSTLLDQIFPRRPAAKLVDSLSLDDISDFYQPNETGEVTALARFQEPAVRASVHEAKFYGSKKAFLLLADLLSKYLLTRQESCLVVPIPLGKKRLRDRGYNQVTEVVKLALRANKNHRLADNILLRTNETQPQTDLPRAERLKNVVGAFSVSNEYAHLLKGAHIIIIDDVATTGATLQAAKATLLPYQPDSIMCVSLAH